MENNTNFMHLFKVLWLYASAQRRLQIGVLLILMIIVSFLEMVSIGALLPFLGVLVNPKQVFEHPFLQFFVETMRYSDPSQLIMPLTAIFIIVILISGSMRLVLLWFQTKFSFDMGADISIDIYKRTLYQPYSVHVARNSSEIIAGISTKVNNVVHHAILPVLTIMSAILITLSIVTALILVKPIIALLTFSSFGLVYFFIMMITKKQLDANGRLISYKQNRVIKSLQEGLGGIRDVLIDGAQQTYCDIFRKADLPLRKAQANVQIISASPRLIIETLSMVIIILIALYLSNESSGGLMDAIPILGAIALGSQRLLPVLQQAYSSWSFIRSGRASLSAVIELLQQPLPENIDSTLVEPVIFNKTITINNLFFNYDQSKATVLKNINLIIEKGSYIGFIGNTGSGKSTLLDLIMGLLKPTEGGLMIDDVKITSKNYRMWQSQIAHVPQDIFLSDSTILENIAFGIPLEEVNVERVIEVAEIAQISETIESWTLGYYELAGEGGVKMSGGQRQRIGIARALYKQADVLVLDEATSALDSSTESLIIESINRLSEEVTIIMVAHRHSTLKKCTKIIEFADGSITRVGTYSEIIHSLNEK
jgi:ATP-binding cassette, subfamily B, bacterial PglK